MDRRFLKYGLTMQEASVLLRCVGTRRITPGKLSVSLGRDKGKITRFVDRLEAAGLITRDTHRRDRRFSVLKATAKGKRVARDLACVFDTIRKELFVGIPENDVRRLSQMLSELHKNATRLGARQRRDAVRRRRRIGMHGRKTEGPQISETQLPAEILTHSLKEHAADSLDLEQEGRQRWSVGSERTVEDRTSRGQIIEKHEEVVLK